MFSCFHLDLLFSSSASSISILATSAIWESIDIPLIDFNWVLYRMVLSWMTAMRLNWISPWVYFIILICFLGVEFEQRLSCERIVHRSDLIRVGERQALGLGVQGSAKLLELRESRAE